jgi:hypothetical protein
VTEAEAIEANTAAIEALTAMLQPFVSQLATAGNAIAVQAEDLAFVLRFLTDRAAQGVALMFLALGCILAYAVLRFVWNAAVKPFTY